MENVTLNDILKISGGIYYGDKELLKQKVTDMPATIVNAFPVLFL